MKKGQVIWSVVNVVKPVMFINDLIISHGKTNHKYGDPCSKCQAVFADNPYVQTLVQSELKQQREKIRVTADYFVAHQLRDEFLDFIDQLDQPQTKNKN